MQIRPLTMSILVGSAACNARCPFCVSAMTPANGVTPKYEPINYKNWNQACTLAERSGVTTILLTGKGEPTLFPAQISEVLRRLHQYQFPIIEMQTNGIPIHDGIASMIPYEPDATKTTRRPPGKVYDDDLQDWFNLGMRTIAISNVGIDPELNRKIYLPYKGKYIDLAATIARIHSFGFSVRLATVMIKGGVDSVDAVEKLVQFAKEHKVEQLSLRPVTKPGEASSDEGKVILGWVDQNYVTETQVLRIKDYVEKTGHRLMELPHGAVVYDLHGQNICLTNCLTTNTDPNSIRQLIYFNDGHLRYSWEYPGAIIL
jgi:molybdenum cofactor biosynthesis enzyme MoaA